MRIITCLCLSLLFLFRADPAAAAPEEKFRTDINPALLYFQAFLLAPTLSDEERDYLFATNWQGQYLPEKFGELISRYHLEMAYLHRAAAQKYPCDWGIDFTPGPETLLPELAACKKVAQAARLHAMWELQQGDENAACQDLIGALAIGRNASRDGTLIAALVQIAIENIVCVSVAESFGHFSPAALQQLEAGLDTAPTRETIGDSFTMERFTFGHWLRDRIVEYQADHPGDDAAVMADTHKLVDRINYEGDTNFWMNLTNSAGDTVDGLIKLTQQAELFGEQLSRIVILPHGEFEKQFDQFSEQVKKSGNFLTLESLNAWPNSRRKEFTVEANLAMVRAAIEYKLHGDDGLKSVPDPFGNGPFRYDRFVFQGQDRGFALKSAYLAGTNAVTMIFEEKDGPSFLVNGNKAGQPAPQ